MPLGAYYVATNGLGSLKGSALHEGRAGPRRARRQLRRPVRGIDKSSRLSRQADAVQTRQLRQGTRPVTAAGPLHHGPNRRPVRLQRRLLRSPPVKARSTRFKPRSSRLASVRAGENREGDMADLRVGSREYKVIHFAPRALAGMRADSSRLRAASGGTPAKPLLAWSSASVGASRKSRRSGRIAARARAAEIRVAQSG